MREAPRLLHGIIVAAVVALSVGSLGAFVILGQSWPTPSADYRINAASFPHGPPGTTDQVIAAIRGGGESWTQQGETQFEFDYLGTTTVDFANSQDAVNALFWSASTSGPALATTFYSWDAQDNLVGFDIVFWGENASGPIIWNGVGDPQAGETDLAGVAGHELGHALGLGHSSDSDATMYAFYGGVEMRTLHPDDIAGVQFLYGFSPVPSSEPQIDDVTPPSGPMAGGNVVVLTGDNFTWTADTVVRVDGVALGAGGFEVESSGILRIASMPGHAGGEVSIEVENELGSVVLAAAYAYEFPPPQVVQVVPAQGPLAGGIAVTVFGFGFIDGTEVTFGGLPLENAVVVDDTRVTGSTPALPVAGFVDIAASHPFGSATLVDGFLYSDEIVRVVSLGVHQQDPQATMEVRGTFPQSLEAYSFVVDFDGEYVDVVDVTVAGSAADGAELVVPILDNGPEPLGSFWSLEVIIDTVPPQVPLAPGEDLVLAFAAYDLTPPAPVETQVVMEFSGAEFQATGGALLTPATLDGLLLIGGGEFRRGDGNQNGVVELADAIGILGYLFGGGSAACLDALDIDDGGGIDLGDAIGLLSFLFTLGEPPAPPFLVPGFDPTEDTLGCEP